MLQKVALLSVVSLLLLLCASLHVEALSEDVPAGVRPYLVKRGDRRSLVVTEYGEISAAEISSGTKGPYHIQFITLEPNSLLLPVLLHADMVFYVQTGNGKLSWTDGRGMKRMNLRRGDVYRLQAGSVFFVQSNLDPERQKMRIHAIFSNTDDIYEPSIGAYSSISDLVLGFDRRVLQAAFKVPEQVLEEITSATKPPAVVHDAVTKDKKSVYWELEDRLVDILTSNKQKKTKETKTFNILDADPDFKNCNGWSLTVDKYSLKSLRDSNVGIFMVNLTKGSMMGPHWNPMATEIALVLHGQGMVRVVCPSTANESECKNMRFKVKEGDVFAVPRFHPMAQMSFNNDSFVFMGFSTSTKINHPQFLTGKTSILRTLDRAILAVSFNVTYTTMDQLLNAQEEALILDCTSCAEEEESQMKEEIQKEKQEEEARKKEEERKREEARKREEEEARKREEEEAKKREEEQARKREEEKKRQEEEERREQEEAERERERQEEEERQRREEEKQQEEARKREEEKRRQEEEERREQEEAEREREQQEEEERQRREEEKQQEEARKREEEKRQQEEEERREQEEAERERERQEEEERQRQEEEKQQEEARKREEEKRQQEKQRQREEAARRENEEARRQQEERQKRRRREEEKERERHEGGGEQPEEREGEARKEDHERKGDEAKGRRALRKVWKL